MHLHGFIIQKKLSKYLFNSYAKKRTKLKHYEN